LVLVVVLGAAGWKGRRRKGRRRRRRRRERWRGRWGRGAPRRGRRWRVVVCVGEG